MTYRPKILVVDDELGTRLLLQTLLSQHDYEINLVESGEDALAFLENNQDIDIILLDVIMFGMDGIETLKIIRKNPKFDDIKIIMSSGLSEPEEMVDAFLAGASDYIIKPHNAVELIARVETQFRLKNKSK